MKKSIDHNEVPFEFDELFFSRTDERGIIMSGNSVFQRISQYSWEELIKKPHNTIRNPDMPKGIFYLLWDFLKKKKPIGAYVKNRAKDGRYYWVFAITTPVEGGYLSVRLKPSSELFPIIQNTYKTLLDNEREQKATPKQSAEHLIDILNKLGFSSYDDFMSVAIRKEIIARNKALGKQSETYLTRFEELANRASEIIDDTSKIFSCYEANQYVPMNLQIQSAQLGDEGKTIGVISGNFSIVSSEIRSEIDMFSRSAREVFDRIYAGQFLICTARIQQEVCNFFELESTNGNDASIMQEMSLLKKQKAEYEKKAYASLQTIMRNIASFEEDCNRMKRCAASLEVIRIMGKVDAALLSNRTSGLSGLIDELGTFQRNIAQSLNAIEKSNNSLKYDVEHVAASLA